MGKKDMCSKIDYMDEKYKNIKGLPLYLYNNGFCIFREEECWGHVNPIEIIYTLVDENGYEIDSSYKGELKNDLKNWDKKYGKRKIIII